MGGAEITDSIDIERRFTPQLGREVVLRHNNSDVQMWIDAFEHGFHIPPDDMPPPRTVLDLGANVGLTAAHYKAIWPEATVHAIEMDWESFGLCVQNTDSVNKDSMLCQWMAVGSTDGWATYSRDGLTPSAYHLDPLGKERVYCTTLRSWLDANGLIDFCKMDVEGAEWEILREPLNIRNLLVEFHGEGESKQILERGIRALEEIGYKTWHHLPHPQAVYAVNQ